ncbi:molybdopterin cofactor-binding domain-containing protein [Zavarzinia sp. CC-PAN008]|uniref:xanthine dehydrogenase family protein molybdopterin-binding subunit n=1 Tax=Zavarzinia sp. CC-PAN008 TaxID=3243332 RepID=UPI003F74825E
MGRVAKIARRTFLFGLAAVAGGVAFGAYLYRRPHDNPLLADLEPDAAAITPWIRIDKSGVTLITPHTEIGQGAQSMQAALLAEELDLDWGQFKVDPGVPAAAYYNGALGEELLPTLVTDTSSGADAARWIGGAMVKIVGVQITGGSSSTRDSWDKLRGAGAVARETLKAAAAQTTGVSVGQLKTAGGAVILPDGRRLPYADLAAVAATLTPVEAVTLRPPEAWRLIGKPFQRLDIVAKSTGTAIFGIDLAFEGMVHATVKLNPRQGGALTRYDAKAAEGMRGVKRIVPVTGGVAVVADNTWRAFQAADAIAFEWGPAPYPPDMAAHWAALSAAFTDAQQEQRSRDDGDVTANLGAQPVTAEYRAPYLAHAPLEPLSAVVKVTDDRADVWAATQIPRFAKANVALVTGLAEDQVHIHNQQAGGSFGHRLEDDHIRRTAEVAVAMKGTPVKLTYRREEDLAHDYPRQIAMARMQGAVKDGRVEALDLSIAMPSITASQFGRQPTAPGATGPDSMISAGAWDQPFAIPHFRMTGYRAQALAPISSWRSVGASTNAFFFNAALDELILAAGADPLAERIRLCNHAPSRKVLEAVGEMSGWGTPLEAGRGRGIAFCHSFGTSVAEVVEVTATPAGIRIHTVFVAAEVGRVVDPVNFDNQVKGAVVWGLGHAMTAETTYADGMAEQTNFDTFTAMRLAQCPKMVVRALESGDKVHGIGEPPVPPAAPALAAAIFAATGTRLREMPFAKAVRFV